MPMGMSMVVKATNQQAHRMAEAGIEFVRLFEGCYLLDPNTITIGQLTLAGVTIRAMI